MNNIIEKYIKNVEKFLINLYKEILTDSYEKKLVEPFVKKYIEIRYYNVSIFEKEKNFITRINKELNIIANSMFKENINKEETIKNIVALFGYVLYFDDCIEYTDLNALINTMFKDTNIKINFSVVNKSEIKTLINDFVDSNELYLELFNDKEFILSMSRIKRNLYKVKLNHEIFISSLYSDYAIKKALESQLVSENDNYLLYVLLSGEILKSIINLEYANNYIVSLPTSLFAKEKKIGKYLKLLDNEIVKSRVHINFKYKEYLENKKNINELINKGYNISITIDDSFNEDFNCLGLFSYIFVYKKSSYYDIIKSRNVVIKNIITI